MGGISLKRRDIKRFLLFAASSFVSWMIDMTAVLGLRRITSGLGDWISLLISVVSARLLSAAVNFLINRSAVFRAQGSTGARAAKFAAVAAASVSMNYLLLYILTVALPLPLPLMKPAVDLSLFLGNYFMQKHFVFNKTASGKDKNTEP